MKILFTLLLISCIIGCSTKPKATHAVIPAAVQFCKDNPEDERC